MRVMVASPWLVPPVGFDGRVFEYGQFCECGADGVVIFQFAGFEKQFHHRAAVELGLDGGFAERG